MNDGTDVFNEEEQRQKDEKAVFSNIGAEGELFLRYIKDSISHPVHAVPQDVLPFPKHNMSALNRPWLAESSTNQTSMPAC